MRWPWDQVVLCCLARRVYVSAAMCEEMWPDESLMPGFIRLTVVGGLIARLKGSLISS
jgi:hypothetical protein